MNRFVLGAVGVAAVLGTSGGVALAAVHQPADNPSVDPSSPAPSALPTAPASSTRPTAPTTGPTGKKTGGPVSKVGAERGLYAVGKVIHSDGRAIRVHLDNPIDDLAYSTDGMVVATVDPGAPTLRTNLWHVKYDGSRSRIGTVADHWDLSADGRRLVGFDTATQKITVWEVETGKVLGRWGRTSDATDRAVFVGGPVRITVMTPGGHYRVYSWDFVQDRTTEMGDDGLARMSADMRGLRVAGLVGRDGTADPQRQDNCLAVRSTQLAKSRTSWFTCEWTNGRLSPNGKKVLATSQVTDAPAHTAVIDAAKGPSAGVDELPASGATRVSWLDNEHVLVADHLDEEGKDERLRRCDLRGHCSTLAIGRRPFIPAIIG